MVFWNTARVDSLKIRSSQVKHMSSRYSRMFAGVVVAASLLGFSALASAIDRVVLKDGRTIDGTIVREASGAVWIKTSVGGLVAEQMFSPSEIARVEKNVSTTAPAVTPADAGGGTTPASTSPALTVAPVAPATDEDKYPPGVPRALVLTLGDRENGHMVGTFMVASILREALPTLDKELGTDKTGVLVLRIHSGGGALIEIQRLSDVIEYEFKPRFRTVGWISYAISAAAMTGHAMEEIYFTTQGSYGSCTAFAGSSDRPVEGFELEKILYTMEKISTRGQHNPLIMRAMQVQQPLSATVTPEGEVRWYPDDTSGEIVVNRPGEILTFNPILAAKVKFSSGTVDTIEELQKAMGFQELHWVGRRVAGVPWPVSRSEQMQMDFRKQTKSDEQNFQRFVTNFQTSVEIAAQQQDRTERARFVGRARTALEQIKNMVKNNPNAILFNWGATEEWKNWLDAQEKLLRDLMR
jgi:hypothetical protein